MPNLHHNNYSYYIKDQNKLTYAEQKFLQGWDMLDAHPLFRKLLGDIYLKQKYIYDFDSAATVCSNGSIYVNIHCKLTSGEWAYTLAHTLLHLAFGHFDTERIPAKIVENDDIPDNLLSLWNKACDIYITQFLIDIKMGTPTCSPPGEEYSIRLNSEEKIFEHLLFLQDSGGNQSYGTTSHSHRDMIGLEKSCKQECNNLQRYIDCFSYTLSHLGAETVSKAGGHLYDESQNTPARKAARWFMGHYPLLGSMASSYRLIEDVNICIQNEIEIAAVDAARGEIYINPACGFTEEEWKFVLAHEFLHAGLMHHKRVQGRHAYLWNIACDYVINGWLYDMQIGTMPSKGLLYDPELSGMSAEYIYDLISKELRKYEKLYTFRGYKKGDILNHSLPTFEGIEKGIQLDEFYRNALREGLDFQLERGRGVIPAGLIEQIYALSMPAIPWDVELGRWFDIQFPPLEKHRTYARPSRRQSATPNIPRPRAAYLDTDQKSRTFGVIVDTSGSVSARELGMALGSIASYAASKEVLFARVVFCDTKAYDAGYLSVEDIAGKVNIQGRGGTMLQPGIELLEKATDFPADGPILVITDGFIEKMLTIHREHAFLLPKGRKLPFQAKGKVFYFDD